VKYRGSWHEDEASEFSASRATSLSELSSAIKVEKEYMRGGVELTRDEQLDCLLTAVVHFCCKFLACVKNHMSAYDLLSFNS